MCEPLRVINGLKHTNQIGQIQNLWSHDFCNVSTNLMLSFFFWGRNPNLLYILEAKINKTEKLHFSFFLWSEPSLTGGYEYKMKTLKLRKPTALVRFPGAIT